MYRFSRRSMEMQKGYVTLAVALLVLFLLTLVTFLSAHVGMMEQRTGANEFWAKQAFQSAETGVQQGIAYLRQNLDQYDSFETGGWMNSASLKWQLCKSTDISLPCGDGTNSIYGSDPNYQWLNYSNIVSETIQPGASSTMPTSYGIHFLVRAAESGDPDPASPIIVISEGFSDMPSGLTKLTEWRDQAKGKSVVQETVVFSPAFGGSIPAPVVASGTIPSLGNMHIVTNPNLGGSTKVKAGQATPAFSNGTNAPLSIWAKDDTFSKGAAETCYVNEFLTTDTDQAIVKDSDGNSLTTCPKCICPAKDPTGSLTDKDVKNIDILDNDPNFPADLFQYVFGIPKSYYMIIKTIAQNQGHLLDSCGSLSDKSSGLFWITGDCDLKENIGSFDKPVLIVIEGTLSANGSTNAIFGLIFSFSKPGGVAGTVKINGTPTIYGAVVIDGDVDNINGTVRIRYDDNVLNNLHRTTNLPVSVPGSWSSF